jgi:hypothetical protein
VKQVIISLSSKNRKNIERKCSRHRQPDAYFPARTNYTGAKEVAIHVKRGKGLPILQNQPRYSSSTRSDGVTTSRVEDSLRVRPDALPRQLAFAWCMDDQNLPLFTVL